MGNSPIVEYVPWWKKIISIFNNKPLKWEDYEIVIKEDESLIKFKKIISDAGVSAEQMSNALKGVVINDREI